MKDLRDTVKESVNEQLKDVEQSISNLSRAQIVSMIASILKNIDNSNVQAPNKELQNIENFLVAQQGVVVVNSEDDLERKKYLKQFLKRSFKYLEHKKGIDINSLGDLKSRIDAFQIYLDDISSKDINLVLRNVCKLFNLLSVEKDIDKIKECLKEYPPNQNELACEGGTWVRTNQQIEKLSVPDYIRPFLNAYNSFLDRSANILKDDVQVGNHIHLKPFLEYCFGFRTDNSIKDPNLHSPKDEVDPYKMQKILKEFASNFRYLFLDQYQDQEYFLIVAEMSKNISDPNFNWNDFGSALQNAGIESIYDLMNENGSFDQNKFLETVGKIRLKQVAGFKRLCSEHLNPLQDQQTMDLKDDSSPQSGSDNEDVINGDTKNEAKILAQKITIPDQQLEALDELWALSYLKNRGDSHILFIRAIYDLGKSLSKENGYEKSKQKYFFNTQQFLNSISNSVPEEQKFKIGDIVDRLDNDKFKYLTIAAYLQGLISGSQFSFDLRQDRSIEKEVLTVAIDYDFDKVLLKLPTIADAQANLVNINIGSRRDGLLNFAARRGSKKIVKMLLDKGSDVNKRNAVGIIPLMDACAYGHIEVVQLLDNSDYFIVDNRGYTALQYAAIRGDAKIVELLMRKYVTSNNLGIKGQVKSAFLSALKEGNFDVAEVILDKVDKKDFDINTLTGDTGLNALGYAVSNGNVDFARKLIDFGADVNYVLNLIDGDASIINLASAGKSKEMVELLLKSGCDIRQKDSDGSTPLHCAIQGGSVDIVNFLINNGANPLEKDNNGDTAIHHAVFSGKVNFIDPLLIGNVGIDTKNNAGYTPLEIACSSENVGLDIINKLIDQGADLEVRNVNGQNLIDISLNKDIVALLLNRGAHIDQKSNLYTACKFGDVLMARLLIARGARVNVEHYTNPDGIAFVFDDNAESELIYDNQVAGNYKSLIEKLLTGTQELICAVESGNIDKVKKYIKEGAVINARGINGKTVLETAMEKNYPEIVELLQVTKLLFDAIKDGDLEKVNQCIARGAIVDAMDENGNTALDSAFINGNMKIAELLIENNAFPIGLFQGGAYVASIFDGDIKRRLEATIEISNYAILNQWNSELVKEYVENGAILNIKNLQGLTLYDIALHQGNDDIAQLIKNELEKQNSAKNQKRKSPEAITEDGTELPLKRIKQDENNSEMNDDADPNPSPANPDASLPIRRDGLNK